MDRYIGDVTEQGKDKEQIAGDAIAMIPAGHLFRDVEQDGIQMTKDIESTEQWVVTPF